MPSTPPEAGTRPPDVGAAPPVTELLRAWGAGDVGATDTLARLVYAELRRQAQLALRREAPGHTLQPTALVHEAWLRLGGQHQVRWESRSQFFALAAQMMRRVLVDHARTRLARKREGDAVRVTLGDAESVAGPAAHDALDNVDLIALDDALARLATLDPQKARLVDLRFFGGLSIPEAAAVLGVSQATIGREWAVARMWLKRELGA